MLVKESFKVTPVRYSTMLSSSSLTLFLSLSLSVSLCLSLSLNGHNSNHTHNLYNPPRHNSIVLNVSYNRNSDEQIITAEKNTCYLILISPESKQTSLYVPSLILNFFFDNSQKNTKTTKPEAICVFLEMLASRAWEGLSVTHATIYLFLRILAIRRTLQNLITCCFHNNHESIKYIFTKWKQ